MFLFEGRKAKDDQRRGHSVRHVDVGLRQLRGAAQALPPEVSRGHEDRSAVGGGLRRARGRHAQ